MSEVFAGARKNTPLSAGCLNGKADWDTISDGYQSTTDYPACTYWRGLADYYPGAKVVLIVRDSARWFDSVSETIFSDEMHGTKRYRAAQCTRVRERRRESLSGNSQ
jgi:sulfotransferase family protein